MTDNMLAALRPYARWILAIFVVSVAFFLCLRFVLTFGVNVPFWDEFQLLDQARLVHSGQLDWWKLILHKHNEHLVGVMFTLEVFELLWTGFDYKAQLVTGVLIQGLTFLLLVAVLWNSVSKERRAVWVAVSSLILFSLAQYKNLLWSFQTAWFLISLMLVIALVCLQKAGQMDDANERGGGTWFAGAVIAALLASFTLFQGMIIWVAGAAYIMGRCSYDIRGCLKSTLMRRWLIAAALAAMLIAFAFFKLGGLEAGYAEFHLRTFLDIVIGLHGDFWGNWGVHRLIRFGGLMLAFVAVALTQVWFSKNKAAYAFPVSLIVFGFCFVVLIALGRGRFGSTVAAESHYQAYPILTYFAALSISCRRDDSLPKLFPERWGQFLFMVAIVAAWFFSSYDATIQGIAWRSDHGLSASEMLDYRNEIDAVLARNLFGDPAMVRRNSEFLDNNKFGPFGDSNAVPPSVRVYATMPKSMEAVIARHPQQEKALQMAWYVYQMGGDLRNAFSPTSQQFPQNYLEWCVANAQPGAAHYLSQYLLPFQADFSTLKKTGF